MSNTLKETPETRHLPRRLDDKLKDPSVGLTELLSETGFEGLDDTQRLEVIEAATLEDYVTIIDVIHRKVAPDANADPHEEAIKIKSPTTGEVSSVTAQPEERRAVMEQALLTAKEVAKKYRAEGGSLKDALHRIANLAAFGTVLAHNYEEGNGRTARTIALLVQNGYDSTDPESVDDLAVVSASRPDGGGSGFRINSYVPSGEWNGRADQDRQGFLDVVASLDAPFDDVSYGEKTFGTFTTSIGP